MFSKQSTVLQTLLRGFAAIACPCAFFTMGADAATFNVTVKNFEFEPKTVNIRAGDTVRWTWADEGHSVTSGTSCTSDGRFNSGIKSTGTFTRTFTQTGQFTYFCIPNCSSGMTGTVKVAAALPPKLMLKFDTMFGVAGLFVNRNPIRGIKGDELPRRVGSAKGQLFDNGRLVINVRGLVFSNSPVVPASLRGKNNEARFRGLVSCSTESGGRVVTRNVITRGFPASTSGNSDISATVSLPRPCVAPIVMVIAGSENKWLAVTGRE